MTDTLRKIGHDRFSVLMVKAMNAKTEEEKRKALAEADHIAQYVLEAYGIADFAYITGAR